MALSGRQFGKYTFYGSKSVAGNVSVAGFETGKENAPAGTLQITSGRASRDRDQRAINNSEYAFDSHRIDWEESGQGRFTGGNFEPVYPKVSWLGVRDAHRNPTLLAGMMGVATHLHGGMPHADSELSEEGAQISRHMVEKWGMKPHPANPEMEANWVPDVDSDALAEDLGRGIAKEALVNGTPWRPEKGDPNVSQTVKALRTLRPSKNAGDHELRESYFKALEDKVDIADRPRYQAHQKETLF